MASQLIGVTWNYTRCGESWFSPTPVDTSRCRAGLYEPDRIKIIEELIPDGLRKKAIDVGCGSGYFSEVLSTRGWSVMAVDTDPKSVENARRFVSEATIGDAISVYLACHRTTST